MLKKLKKIWLNLEKKEDEFRKELIELDEVMDNEENNKR